MQDFILSPGKNPDGPNISCMCSQYISLFSLLLQTVLEDYDSRSEGGSGSLVLRQRANCPLSRPDGRIVAQRNMAFRFFRLLYLFSWDQVVALLIQHGHQSHTGTFEVILHVQLFVLSAGLERHKLWNKCFMTEQQTYLLLLCLGLRAPIRPVITLSHYITPQGGVQRSLQD